jgi:hypothetical protein
VLEIHNVPTALILYAIEQWTLCNKYAHKTGVGNNTNPFLRAVAVWILLKHETTSGKIKHYRKQLPQMATKCKMSVRSLDSYLAWLKKEELAHVEGTSLVLHSYQSVKKYGINIQQRQQTILYDTNSKASFAHILAAIGVEKLKDKPRTTYWKKVTKNPDALAELRTHLIAYGADATRLDTDPEYFRLSHLQLLEASYKNEGPGRSSFYLLHKFIDANPDINYKAATYAFKMGYSVQEREDKVTGKDEAHSSGFSRLKHKLKALGLITVKKAHIESEYRARKDEKIFHHRYVRRTKKTIWFRPDQININNDAIYRKNAA